MDSLSESLQENHKTVVLTGITAYELSCGWATKTVVCGNRHIILNK